eukprot:PhM_4_TR4371/c0_g1_i1/m.70732
MSVIPKNSINPQIDKIVEDHTRGLPHPLGLYPRLMFDLTAADLAHAMRLCLRGATHARTADGRAALQREVGAVWNPSQPDNVAVMLSCRTAFDAYLQALALPAESEVVLCGITIPHMIEIMRRHGLVVRTFDFDVITFRADVAQAKKLITKRTKLMVVAHLFGRRIENVNELIALAKANNLRFVDDSAQAFVSRPLPVHPDTDLQLVSFGSIKHCTALGLGLAYVRDNVTLKKMRMIEGKYGTRTTSTFMRQISKYALLTASDNPTGFGLAARAVALSGGDFAETVNKLSRGFPGEDDLLTLIRFRPCQEQIEFLKYRLQTYPELRATRRCQSGWDILSRLPPYVEVASGGDPRKPRGSNFWLFTMSCREPSAVQRIMQHQGFDVALGTSQLRAGSADGSCPSTETFMRHVLYFPVYAELADADRNHLLDAIARVPRSLIESPSEAFHQHVARMPQKHAYRSAEVSALLKDREPFVAPTLLPSHLVTALQVALGYRVGNYLSSKTGWSICNYIPKL